MENYSENEFKNLRNVLHEIVIPGNKMLGAIPKVQAIPIVASGNAQIYNQQMLLIIL